LETTNVARSRLLNETTQPFDNPEVRRAMALALDRKGFIDILSEGQDRIGGLMLPPPEGVWGLPPDILNTLPGYGPDVEESRAEARRLLQGLGRGPDKPLKIKFATRNAPEFRDTTVILMDQLKQIGIDSELDLVETVNWFPRLARKEYQVGFIFSLTSVDDRTSSFTRTTPAVRNATTWDIATMRWRGGSSGNRSKPTGKSASSWSGRSTATCSRTPSGRSSRTPG